MTPFEKAGYSKYTKFRVLGNVLSFKKDDIVTLEHDNGRYCPWFKTEDGRKIRLCLPNMAPEGFEEELEVYEEEDE